MSVGHRLLTLLFAFLFLPGVGAMDFCACGPSGHGAFCADEPEPERGGCCSAKQEAPAGPQAHEEGCDCPVVLLEDGPEKTAPTVLDEGPSTAVVLALHPSTYAPRSALTAAPAEAAPRPPPRRLHLLLNVFRC